MSAPYIIFLAALLASVATQPYGILGGISPVDPNNKDYQALAQESFEKYKEENPSGADVEVKEIKVTKASNQVVAGLLKRIDFTVYPINGEEFTCHSEVLEPVGNAEKKIDVTCVRKQDQDNDAPSRIPGGISPDDPNNKEYQALAQESFEKYKEENPSGADVEVKEIKVTKASNQVVAGLLKRIDFTVYPVNGEEFTCHSEVLEPVGNAEKKIDVICDRKQDQDDDAPSGIPGGISPDDTNNKEYQALAQESFEKYKEENPSGADVEVKEIKVTKASNQVVAGLLKRIDFTVYPVNGEEFTCHSEVLEPVGNAEKKIDVTCNRNEDPPMGCQ